MRRGSADKYSWIPFTALKDYDHQHWWQDARGTTGDAWFVQVLEDTAEAARVLFDDPGGINPAYTDVPELGPERLEIQFIEVATSARGRGVGTRVVHALADRHPDRRLFAYSEGADEFWASLGWGRFDRPCRPPARALFIQPAEPADPAAGT